MLPILLRRPSLTFLYLYLFSLYIFLVARTGQNSSFQIPSLPMGNLDLVASCVPLEGTLPFLP